MPILRKYFFTLLIGLQFCSCSPQIKGNENDASSDTIFHVIMYGQSLMLGTQSVPLISTTQKYNSLMFEGGLRPGYDTSSHFYEKLVPLVEKVSISPYSGGKLGETPASGFSEHFLDLLQKENGYKYDQDQNRFDGFNHRLLISIPAQGSTSAKALTDDGEFWERFKRDIFAGSRLAKAAGSAYQVPFVIWNQGERDIDQNTSPSEYKETLISFQKKADQFIKSVTHQSRTVRLILYQTSSHNVRHARNNPAIANAQYELAKSEPNITMSNATYQLPYFRDQVHFTNIGSKANGANHAIAAKRILIDGVDWKPIYVEGASFRNHQLILNFHVPVPPLVLDTSIVSNPGNFGFRIFQKDGTELSIESVKLMGKDKVSLLVDRNLAKGDMIWYGNNGTGTGPRNGARGNLRDSQGKLQVLGLPEGKTIRLDNWCPIFKETL